MVYSIRPIRTDDDRDAALAEVRRLSNAKPGADDADWVRMLNLLIGDYEARVAQGLPDPVAAIKARMEQMALTRKDLEPMIGPRSRVHDVLKGKRPLSLSMIRRLHEQLGISASVLIGPSTAQDFAGNQIASDKQDQPLKKGVKARVATGAPRASRRRQPQA